MDQPLRSFQQNSEKTDNQRKKAFSLIEVVLAMGIFLITVLTLVGIMGPALKSVSTIQTSDEATSVVDSVNAFLNTSPFIDSPAADGNSRRSRFDSIYRAIQNNGYATLFVYRWYDAVNQIVRQEIGFNDNEGGSTNPQSVVNANNRGNGVPTASFANATSPIYRVVLTASSAMLSDPDDIISASPTGNYSYYTLTNDVAAYQSANKSYLAIEARVFAEDPGPSFDRSKSLNDLANEQPILTYDTAILRD